MNTKTWWTHSKTRGSETTTQHIICGSYYLDDKTRQCKKTKLNANFPSVFRCKNSQQNISNGSTNIKCSHTTDKKDLAQECNVGSMYKKNQSMQHILLIE
jgi:hypothetical protein